MSGSSVLIDTNIIIYLLRGDKTVESILENREVYISFISEIELKSAKVLSKEDEKLIQRFLSYTEVIHSNGIISELAAEIRQHKHVKIPDAIIAATALSLGLPLLTADKRLTGIKDLSLINYNPDM